LARHTEPVAVIGLGRFGSALALELARRGTEVLGIDSRENVVQRLAGQLGRVVAADSTDIDALRELGLESFTRAVVAIGTDQQSSILTTALLVDLEIEDIWAKALDAQHAKILARIGAHHVIQPESEMGERVAHLVSGRMLDYIELDKDWALITTPGSTEMSEDSSPKRPYVRAPPLLSPASSLNVRGRSVGLSPDPGGQRCGEAPPTRTMCFSGVPGSLVGVKTLSTQKGSRSACPRVRRCLPAVPCPKCRGSPRCCEKRRSAASCCWPPRSSPWCGPTRRGRAPIWRCEICGSARRSFTSA
jgi:trk system potassium uptake protein